jgi:hypothetical protein
LVLCGDWDRPQQLQLSNALLLSIQCLLLRLLLLLLLLLLLRLLLLPVQVLTWLVLPFFQVYADAGDFTVSGRCLTSLKENGLLYGLAGAAGVCACVCGVEQQALWFE